MPRSFKLVLLCCLAVPVAARAQSAGQTPALQIVNDVAAPGVVVPANPAPPAPVPMTTAAPAAQAAPPAPALSTAADGGIVQFPITEKTHSDTLNPAAPATPPVPAPDVAASLATPTPPVKLPAAPAPATKALIAKAPAMSATVLPARLPPVPKPRPAVMAASTNDVKAAATAIDVPPPAAPAETILTRKAAGPHMPVIRPTIVEAEPLNDPLARQLLRPDKQELVKAIEAVAARQPAPTHLAPVAQIPAATVITPAEALNPQKPAAGAMRGNVITLPARPGETTLSPAAGTLLASQALPVLMGASGRALRIDAYASAVSDEPLNARRIALTRALTVRAWLMDHGVAARRIDLRAFGPEAGHSPADETKLTLLPPH